MVNQYRYLSFNTSRHRLLAVVAPFKWFDTISLNLSQNIVTIILHFYNFTDSRVTMLSIMINRKYQRKMEALNCAMLGFLSLLVYLIMLNHKDPLAMEDLPTLELVAYPQPQYFNEYQHNPGERLPVIMNLSSFGTKRFLSPPEGRSTSLYETNRAFIVLEEMLQHSRSSDDENTTKNTFIIEYSTVYNKKQFVIVHVEPPTLVKASHYIIRNPYSTTLKLGDKSSTWQNETQQLKKVSDYFEYLHTMQGQCRKLVRLGGSQICGNSGDDNHMDGNKLVCLEPEMELMGRRDPKSCLVFSYGISNDPTFDDSVTLLPCEIHMFDKLDFKPTYILDSYPHAYFHQVGIADGYRAEFYPKFNKTLMVDTLLGHVMKNKLMGRPMNILKIDIENGEWEVLQSLHDNPFLDLTGQIALEVHATELLNKTQTEQLEYVQYRYDILRLLEARGFRMVAYWDNHQDQKYRDENGAQYDLCGELLYVNRNWYNATFKATLRNYGFTFRNST